MTWLTVVISVIVALLAVLRFLWDQSLSPGGGEHAELIKLSLGSQIHYASIRSSLPSLEDAPILLNLHGGPGASAIPYMKQTDYILEQHFVVVNYDQRSTGKSCKFYDEATNLTIEQHLADAVDMIEYLRDRFRQGKVYILAGSWGSVLAMLLARDYPHLLHHVGVRGLVVDPEQSEVLSNKFILSKFPEFEGKTKPPPYGREVHEMARQRAWLYRAGGMKHACSSSLHTCSTYDLSLDYAKAIIACREMSWADVFRFRWCYMNTLRQIWPQVESFKAHEEVPRIQVPILVLHGRHDHCTDAELVSRYVDSLEAPSKKLVWFETSAHSPQIEESELFQKTVLGEFLGIKL